MCVCVDVLAAERKPELEKISRIRHIGERPNGNESWRPSSSGGESTFAFAVWFQ